MSGTNSPASRDVEKSGGAEMRRRLRELRDRLGARWLDAATEVDRQEVLLEMENLHYVEELLL